MESLVKYRMQWPGPEGKDLILAWPWHHARHPESVQRISVSWKVFTVFGS